MNEETHYRAKMLLKCLRELKATNTETLTELHHSGQVSEEPEFKQGKSRDQDSLIPEVIKPQL